MSAYTQEIRSQAGNSGTVEVAQLDLASLDSVRNFAHKINRRNVKLDFLVCNAGIMAPLHRCETVDGLEQQFQVKFSCFESTHKVRLVILCGVPFPSYFILTLICVCTLASRTRICGSFELGVVTQLHVNSLFIF